MGIEDFFKEPEKTIKEEPEPKIIDVVYLILALLKRHDKKRSGYSKKGFCKTIFDLKKHPQYSKLLDGATFENDTINPPYSKEIENIFAHLYIVGGVVHTSNPGYMLFEIDIDRKQAENYITNFTNNNKDLGITEKHLNDMICIFIDTYNKYEEKSYHFYPGYFYRNK